MTTTYSRTSPYFDTDQYSNFLDVWKNRPIPKLSSDVMYQIDAVYQYRPDMLAYDLYGTAALWWVFAARNPNVIYDPIFDFRTGVIIYIPKKETLNTSLGL